MEDPDRIRVARRCDKSRLIDLWLKIRLIKSDDELTLAALAALHRRSDEELRRLADRANSRG